MRRLARAAVALLALTLPPAATAETILAPGEPLTRDAVATLVHAGLVDRGVAPEVVVEVDTPGPAVPNRALTPMRVALADLRYDPDSGHYTARLRATLATGESTLIDSNGKVHELVPVVRLRRPLSPPELRRGRSGRRLNSVRFGLLPLVRGVWAESGTVCISVQVFHPVGRQRRLG